MIPTPPLRSYMSVPSGYRNGEPAGWTTYSFGASLPIEHGQELEVVGIPTSDVTISTSIDGQRLLLSRDEAEWLAWALIRVVQLLDLPNRRRDDELGIA